MGTTVSFDRQKQGEWALGWVLSFNTLSFYLLELARSNSKNVSAGRQRKWTTTMAVLSGGRSKVSEPMPPLLNTVTDKIHRGPFLSAHLMAFNSVATKLAQEQAECRGK